MRTLTFGYTIAKIRDLALMFKISSVGIKLALSYSYQFESFKLKEIFINCNAIIPIY